MLHSRTNSREYKTRTTRSYRQQLAQKNPPVILCMLAFAAAAALIPGISFLLNQNPQQIVSWPVAGILGLSLLAVLFRATRRRRPGQPARTVTGYFVIGLCVGGLCIGSTFLIQNANAADVAPDNVMNSPVSPVVSDWAEASDDDIIDREPLAVQDPEPVIPSATPVVLRAGTRLQSKEVSTNNFEVRLESEPGVFQSGLRKSDFLLHTTRGKPVSFQITEVTGHSVALRSNVAIVVDESLPQQYRSELEPIIETILTSADYGSYKLASGGSISRTFVDWTNRPYSIRDALSRIPYSQGQSLSTAVGLNLTDLRRRQNRRILVVIENPGTRSLIDSASSTINYHLRDNSIQLVVVRRRRVSGTNPLRTKHICEFDDLTALARTLEGLTQRHEPPCYRIRTEGSPTAGLQLTIGAGDSALTDVIRHSK